MAEENEKHVQVTLSIDEAKLMIQMVKITPIQGNLSTLPAALKTLISIQEKLVSALNLEQNQGTESKEIQSVL